MKYSSDSGECSGGGKEQWGVWLISRSISGVDSVVKGCVVACCGEGNQSENT